MLTLPMLAFSAPPLLPLLAVVNLWYAVPLIVSVNPSARRHVTEYAPHSHLRLAVRPVGAGVHGRRDGPARHHGLARLARSEAANHMTDFSGFAPLRLV